MPGAADWQNLPNSVTDSIDNQQTADQWASDQRAQVAQDWANVQQTIPDPQPAAPDLSEIGSWATPSSDLAAGASAPPPEQSAASSPAAPAAAASALPAPDAPVTAPLVAPSGTSDTSSAPSVPNGQFSPYDDVFRKYAGPFANDPEFIKIVAAGTLAESSWNANSTTGDGGHSWGLFQMHDHGAGAGMGDARLDPNAASAVMVPKYAAAYAQLKDKLSGPALAAAVAQAAENSADRTGSRYAAAYKQISGGNAPNVVASAKDWIGQQAGNIGNAVGGAAQNAVNTVAPAVQDFAQNGPIGATRDLAGNAADYVLGGGLKRDVATGLDQGIPGVPSPVTSAAASIAKAPSIVDNVAAIGDLVNKYTPPGKSEPDFSNITPEDQATLRNAMVAVGGIEAPSGSEFDQFGVQKGFDPTAGLTSNAAPAADQSRPLFGRGGVPGADVGRNPVPAGTSPTTLDQSLAQTIVDQGRAKGMADEDIANTLRQTGASEDQIQNALNPGQAASDAQAQPTDQAPPIQYDENGNIAAISGKPVLPGATAQPPFPNLADNPPSSPGGPSLGQTLSAIPAEAKKSIFSLSNVHAGNIARGLATSPAGPKGAAQFVGRYVNALVHGPSDPAAESDMVNLATNAMRDGVKFFNGQNPETGGAPAGFNPIMTAAARAAGGAVLGAAGGAEYSNQTHDDQMLRDAVLGGTVGALGGPTVAMRMHDALWQDAVPFAKLMTYKAAVDAGVDGHQAAMFANNLNGGQNLAAIAGSKPVEELARWALQSPDWLLSQAKLVGAGAAGTAKTVAGKPLTGNEQLSRDWLLKSLMVYGFATEAIQYGLTGHFTDQNSPGSQFQIELPSGTPSASGKAQNLTVSLFPGNLQQVLDAADRSATQGPQGLALTAWGKSNRIPATALEEWGNFRFPGGPPITSKGAAPQEAAKQRAVFAGSEFAPLGIFGPASEVAAGASPAATAFLTALGFPMSHNTRKPIGGVQPWQSAPTSQPTGPNRYGANGTPSGGNRYASRTP